MHFLFSTGSTQRLAVLFALGISAGTTPLTGALAATTTGSVLSEVGNQGNPVTIRSVGTTGPGTFATGPLTGSGGDNTTQGQITVDYAPAALPSLTGTATGATQASSLDAAFTSINVDLTYEFVVTGPAPAIAPVRFGGITEGKLVSQGEAARLYGEVGTRVRIISPNIAGSFAAIGAQAGTAPDYFASNAGMVNLGWGAQAFEPVAYTDYASTWNWGANLPAGQTGTVTISTSLRGGTTGALRGTSVLTSSTVESYVDPFIYIDPGWLLDHPGYAISVEADIGNVGSAGAIPEPPASLLLAASLACVLLWHRFRRERAC